MRPDPLERLLTVAETAEYLRVSEKSVRRLIAASDLEAVRVGRQWRITVGAIKRYLHRGV